jgi:hypothetical protein
MRSALEDALSFLLRHASDHGKHFALAGGALELIQPVEYLLLGLVANAAGVVHNQSSGFGSLDLGVAAMNKSSDDLLGIMRVHLAAEGLDVESLLGHYVLIIGQDKGFALEIPAGFGSQESGVRMRKEIRILYKPDFLQHSDSLDSLPGVTAA